MKKMTIILKMKEGTRSRGQTNFALESEKVHSTGEIVIVAKFGYHVLHCLASNLLNVIRLVGRKTKFQFG